MPADDAERHRRHFETSYAQQAGGPGGSVARGNLIGVVFIVLPSISDAVFVFFVVLIIVVLGPS